MISWRPIQTEGLVLYSPIGLLLIDDLTGRPPFGALGASLDLQVGAEWSEVDGDPVFTGSGVLTYPGLGRTDDVTQPLQRYRVRLESPFYRGLYRANTDGIEFDVPPFNDTNPPPVITDRTTPVTLLPAASYPFAPYIPVVRGVVEDLLGNPVADVLVQESLRERTLTDERGTFSLALRWVPPGVPTAISAVDQRNGRAGSINITLPGVLGKSQRITVL
jgi:hypothetical protein